MNKCFAVVLGSLFSLLAFADTEFLWLAERRGQYGTIYVVKEISISTYDFPADGVRTVMW